MPTPKSMLDVALACYFFKDVGHHGAEQRDICLVKIQCDAKVARQADNVVGLFQFGHRVKRELPILVIAGIVLATKNLKPNATSFYFS